MFALAISLHAPHGKSIKGDDDAHTCEQPACANSLCEGLGHCTTDGIEYISAKAVECDKGSCPGRHVVSQHGVDESEDEHSSNPHDKGHEQLSYRQQEY